MSASFFSGEVKPTKRYRLGQLLRRLTRHFLLLTATPHNGKEEDSQLFLALLDADRFEGRFVTVCTSWTPQHLSEVKTRREELIRKTMVAVKDRLTKEIVYWDHRAEDLKAQELAGRPMAKINSALARQRADELEGRLRRRLEELEQERHLSPLPPVVIGGALIVPQCVMNRRRGEEPASDEVTLADRARIDRLAIEAVMATERRLGRAPREMPHDHPGYDIETKDPSDHRLYFIEVKGKAVGATTVTVSKTQILTPLNKPDAFILAVVEVDGETARTPSYIRRPFHREPDFSAVSITYNLRDLLERAEEPR